MNCEHNVKLFSYDQVKKAKNMKALGIIIIIIIVIIIIIIIIINTIIRIETTRSSSSYSFLK